MKIVNEMPKTGSFVAVWNQDGVLHCESWAHIDGALHYLYDSDADADGGNWYPILDCKILDDLVKELGASFVVE